MCAIRPSSRLAGRRPAWRALSCYCRLSARCCLIILLLSAQWYSLQLSQCPQRSPGAVLALLRLRRLRLIVGICRTLPEQAGSGAVCLIPSARVCFLDILTHACMCSKAWFATRACSHASPEHGDSLVRCSRRLRATLAAAPVLFVHFDLFHM